MEASFWDKVQQARLVKSVLPHADSAQILDLMGVSLYEQPALYANLQRLLTTATPLEALNNMGPMAFRGQPAPPWGLSIPHQLPSPFIGAPVTNPVVVTEAVDSSRMNNTPTSAHKSGVAVEHLKRNADAQDAWSQFLDAVFRELEGIKEVKGGLNARQVEALKLVVITPDIVDRLKEEYEKAMPAVKEIQEGDTARKREVSQAVLKWVKLIAKAAVGVLYTAAQGDQEPPTKMARSTKLEEILMDCYEKDKVIKSLRGELENNRTKGVSEEKDMLVGSLRMEVEKKDLEITERAKLVKEGLHHLRIIQAELKETKGELEQERAAANGLKDAFGRAQAELADFEAIKTEVEALRKAKAEAEAKVKSMMGTTDVSLRAKVRKLEQERGYMKSQLEEMRGKVEDIHKKHMETEVDDQKQSCLPRLVYMALEASFNSYAPPATDCRAPLYAPDFNLMTYLREAEFLTSLPAISPASLTRWDTWDWDRAVLKKHLRRFCKGKDLDINHIISSLVGSETGAVLNQASLPLLSKEERAVLVMQFSHLSKVQGAEVNGHPYYDWDPYTQWWNRSVKEYVEYQERRVNMPETRPTRSSGRLLRKAFQRFVQLKTAYQGGDTGDCGQLYRPTPVQTYDAVLKPAYMQIID